MKTDAENCHETELSDEQLENVVGGERHSMPRAGKEIVDIETDD